MTPLETDLTTLDIVLSVLLGLGLSAACGFRVFVPLLVVSLASLTGHLDLASGFAWIGTWPALGVFAAATVLEVGAYYVPWLDNLLDALGAPAAVVAGVITTASMVTGMDPMLKWTLAVIAGGGIAGAVHGATAVVRQASSLATGGLGNPVVSTLEAGGSLGLSLLAVVLPLAAAVAVLFLLLFLILRALRWRRGGGAQAVP